MNWEQALKQARTVVEVIDLVDDFISTRSDVYWQGLPEHLRNPVIAADVDLERWHHALVDAIVKMNSPGTPMQESCTFALLATVRVHQIRLQEDPGSTGSSNDPKFSAASRPRRRA